VDLEWLNALPVFDRRELSPQAQRGLSAARALEGLRGNEYGPAIRDLAEWHDCDSSTIRRWIYKARLELTRNRRRCAECESDLPRNCRQSRRYCDQHAGPAARISRHRSSKPTR